MKKTLIIMLAALVAILGVQPCYAASPVPVVPPSAANISVFAKVPNHTPSLTLLIKELDTIGQDPWTGTEVRTMNFGQLMTELTDGTSAGVWYSRKYYCVFLYTTSFGHRYEVRSTCAGLSYGGKELPKGSFMLKPGYAAQDVWSPGNPQGTQPAGSTLGEVSSAVKTDKMLYRSETGASNRIIRAFYSLPSYLPGGGKPYPGYQPIPLSQAPGSYTGTVVITIAAI